MKKTVSGSTDTGHISEKPFAGYRDAEQYLLGLVNYEQLPPPRAAEADGWNMREFAGFLKDIGNPHEGLPIIHVAGTKGKGSTTRMIASLLRAQGWKKVGAFTSPHIHSFRERIAINDRPISDHDFRATLETVRKAHAVRPGEGFRTTFEVLTAMAFHYFRSQGCDAVVLETGLGGRLDSTNAATAEVAVLTAIGFEHQRVLGNTLEAIAREKAGILKAGTGFALVGRQLPARRRTIGRIASEQARSAGVKIASIDALDPVILRAEPLPGGFLLDLRIDGTVVREVRLPVLGRHQLDNLELACHAVRIFADRRGRRLDPSAIRRGIESIRLAGKLECVQESPTILLDSAHCPMSIRSALSACSEHFPGSAVVLALGLMRDKKPGPILRAIAASGSAEAVLTYAPLSPRARPSEDLADRVRRQIPNAKAKAFPDISDALAAAWEMQRERRDLVLLVTGSVYSLHASRVWILQHPPERKKKPRVR